MDGFVDVLGGWFPDFAEAKVESISPVRLYYVYAGRNAWHSTWVTTYSEGCMHVSFKSAADFVEKNESRDQCLISERCPVLHLGHRLAIL